MVVTKKLQNSQMLGNGYCGRPSPGGDQRN
jgi:hypothetical protein